MGRLLKTSSAPRRVFVTLASAGLTTLLASFSGIAEASEPDNFSADPSTSQPAISGGADAGTCAFPAVVVGPSACSATLIHPRVILCAAHCSGNINSVRFSESAQGGGRTVPVDYCAWYPGYNGNSDQAHDWSLCVLAEPVYDVPIIPPAVGCEADVKIGDTVVMVGYGDSFQDGGWGTKRYSQTEISNTMEGTIFIGPNSNNACPGDSGGPLLVKYADNTWRTVGIASTLSGDCGSPGAFNAYAAVADAIPWVEETTGIDVTPCHDADGKWNPSSQCTGFWTGDQQGFGSWNNWCSGTPSGGPSTTCGPDFNATPEADAPTIGITSPSDGAEYSTDPDSGTVAVMITAEGNDGDGWGVQRAELMIDGNLIGNGVQTEMPYLWNADFPSGEYDLQVIAYDHWDNSALSNIVTVYIDVDPPESTTTNADSASSDDGGSSATGTDTTSAGEDEGGSAEVGTSSGGANDDEGASGCACGVGSQNSPLPGFALFALLGLGRRRRPH